MPDPQPRARTKIIATVGPACRSEEKLTELIEAGADVFRLNMAYGTHEKHDQVVRWIRRLSRQYGPRAILVDLAGPKIRLGELAGGKVVCREGEEIFLDRGKVATAAGRLVASYPKLIDDIAAGDSIMLADGTVELAVEQIAGQSARCRVVRPGEVRSRQGLNLPGVKLSVAALSDKDREDAAWAAEAGVDFVGLSFVGSEDDVTELQQLLRDHGSSAHVIAKIERQEAAMRLGKIIEAADGVMVARGDLGVETPLVNLAVLQKEITSLCSRHCKPVIVATQMLDSMQRNSQPTRAEVTDITNAILDGADACMLSGETAVGQYPRESVEMMNRIAMATEEYLHRKSLPVSQIATETVEQHVHMVTRSVVRGAIRIAADIDARYFVVATRTGGTARVLSKRRSNVPVLGASNDPAVVRRMCLCWGITPLAEAPADDPDALLRHVDAWGQKDGCLRAGDRVVVLAGRGLQAGVHNCVLVHEVEPA